MPSSFRVFTADADDDASRVLEFYRAHPDPHMMPRGLPELQLMAVSKSLYALEDERQRIAGVAYLDYPTDLEKPAEFGGIYFAKDHRTSGIALDFCAIVLGTVIAQYSEDEFRPVIAHTHVANGRPHKVLHNLGFAPLPILDGLDAARYPKMRQSIDGKIWGVRHGYVQSHLANSLAALIRGFGAKGTLGTSGVPTEVDVYDNEFATDDAPATTWDALEVAEELERLAVLTPA